MKPLVQYAVLAVLFVGWIGAVYWLRPSLRRHPQTVVVPPSAAAKRVPSLERNFVRYIPSTWEKEWHYWVMYHPNIDDDPCIRLREQRPRVDEYLKRLEEGLLVANDTTTEDPIFSKMVFKYAYMDVEYARYIEPLVGLLRHPLMCWDKDQYIVNKSYLLLDGYKGNGMHTLYFDLGASTWSSGAGGPSQVWFYEEYKRRGLPFDAMFLWEASPVNHGALLREIPEDVLPIYQYYNIPVEIDHGGEWSVLRALKQRTAHYLARFSYFTVLKIDIDDPVTEKRIIQAILDDPKVLFLLDELFFEHHTYVKPMLPSWHTGPMDDRLDESYRIFTALRRAGVRAHSWV